MKSIWLTALASAVVVILGQPQANACGDKLSMMGGGVSFELVNQSRHHGNVVLFITPDSALYASRADVTKSLERVGHTVQSVDSAAALKSAVQAGNVDLVLTNLGGDGTPVAMPAGARPPATLAIVYKPTASDVSGASINGTCSTQYDKPRGHKLPDAVENVLANKGVGLTSTCSPVGETKST